MILYYHKVHPEPKTIWWVTPDTFEAQMLSLTSKTVVYLADYDPNNPDHVVITFDGPYKNLIDFALPILRKYQYPFELFVIGGHIGGDNAFDVGEPLASFCDFEDLQLLVKNGGRVQWHTMSHKKLKGMSMEQLEFEITPLPELVERFESPNLEWFAYPNGENDSQAISEVAKRYSGALGTEDGDSGNRFLLPRTPATEQTQIPSPKVTVIIANYNYGRFLGEAIDSVLFQTVAPDEIIVIDDASTDDTASVLERYKQQVQIIRNETNLGIVDNFNKAVNAASGDYVAILGADNRMRSDYVERSVAALNSDPRSVVAYTDMAIFGNMAEGLAIKAGATKIGWSETERWPIFYWRFPEASEEVINKISEVNFIHGSSMYKKQIWEQIGGYLKSEEPEDQNLFSRMLQLGVPIKVNEALIEYRQHSQGQANSVLMVQRQMRDLKRENQELAIEIARLNGEVSDFKNSISWKFTQPIRTAVDGFGHFVNSFRK